MNKSPCAEFEAWARRRARGKLDPDAVTRLDWHLSVCDACRAFAATAAAEARAVTTPALPEAAVVDITAARAAFARRHIPTTREVLLTIGSATLAAVACGRSERWIVGVLIGLLLAAVATEGLFVHPRRGRRARAASDADFLALYREQVDREVEALRNLKDTVWLVWMVAGGVLLLLIWDVARADHGGGRTGVVVAMLASSCSQVYRLRVVLPRLEREREVIT